MQEIEKITHFVHVYTSGCTKIPHHLTHYHDLTIAVKGEMTYFCNGEKIELKPGDAVYLPPEIWRDRLKGEKYCEFISYNFLTGCNDPIFPENHIKCCYSARIKKLMSLYGELHLSSAEYSFEKCRLILKFILCEIAETYQKLYQNDYVNKIISYIDLHINEHITLDALSAELHITKEYCSYIFHRETGKTIINYINEKKTECAKNLISGENMSLTDISESLGFDDYNYFSRMFKKYCGMSPSEYKKL